MKKDKPKYPNFPPVRSPSEEFLRLCREKSDATGVPLAFVQRRALEDWLKGLYDPATHNVIEEGEPIYAKMPTPEPHQSKAVFSRGLREKGDGKR